jgi:hypothetical protein
MFPISLFAFYSYHKQGAKIIAEFKLKRSRFCSISQAVMQLAHFTVQVLRLLPDKALSASHGSGAPAASSSSSSSSTFANSAGSSSSSSSNSTVETPAMLSLASQACWGLLSDEKSLQVTLSVMYAIRCVTVFVIT